MYQTIITKFRKHQVLAVLVSLSLASLIFIYLSTSQKKAPLPPILPVSTPVPLKIINIYPQGNFVAVFSSTALTVSFNQAVSLSQVRLEITPPIQLIISLSPDHTILLARPATDWKYQNYSVTVVGPGGSNLAQYQINFQDPAKTPANGGDR